MSTKVKPIPDGYHTVTPFLSLSNASEAIEFYKKAFNAVVKEIHQLPNKKVMHSVLQIGNSLIMAADEFPESNCGISAPHSLNGTTSSFHLYVENADVIFNQAVKAGGTVVMPISDTFWGDRYGQIKDPFGHLWSIATHIKDMTPEQVDEAANEFMAQIKK